MLRSWFAIATWQIEAQVPQHRARDAIKALEATLTARLHDIDSLWPDTFMRTHYLEGCLTFQLRI